MKTELPDEFVKRYDEILGSRVDKFLEYLIKPIKPGIRVNTLKVEPEKLAEMLNEHYGWKPEPVRWMDYAFRLDVENPGASIESMAGLYYVQELSSMIPPMTLDPKPGEKILDIAAAPGSKTTHIGQLMKNTGGVLANEASRKRIAILYNNVKRIGLFNVRIRLGDGRRIPGKDLFDKALVDAPCSSEGTMQKTEVTAKLWSLNFVNSVSRLQRQLLASAVRLTKPGGRIVYSTCTFEPIENEEVVDWALENLPVRLERIDIPRLDFDRGLPGYESSGKVLRIWPWHEMEGFFVASLVKED